jgi:hypothetical protein
MVPVSDLVARDNFHATIGAIRARGRCKVPERQLAKSDNSGAPPCRNTLSRRFARHIPAAAS